MKTDKKNFTVKVPTITLPQGHFCGGDCSDCIYYDRSERNGDRCWCTKRNSWYSPSERRGCFDYRRDYSRTYY